MQLIFIGGDKSAADRESATRERLRTYADLVSSCTYLLACDVRDGVGSSEDPEHRLMILPASGRGKLSTALHLVRLALAHISKKDPEVVVSVQDPFFLGLLGYLVSRFAGVALHVQLHTDPWSDAWKEGNAWNDLRLVVAGFVLRRADAVRVVSERAKRGLLLAHVPEDHITVVPVRVPVERLLADVPTFSLKDAYPMSSKIILSVGRLAEEKDLSTLLRAFREVRKVEEDALLLVVGSGPERPRLLSLASSLGLDRSVQFLPWARDVLSYYKGADCFVQSSKYEGWGMTVIEALACGTPVVMTDVGCAGEVVRDEETGLVVPVGDSEALGRAILRVLLDGELAARLRAAGPVAVLDLPSEAETLRLQKESWVIAQTLAHQRLGLPDVRSQELPHDTHPLDQGVLATGDLPEKKKTLRPRAKVAAKKKVAADRATTKRRVHKE